jgi:hypothetical protein
MNIKYEPASVPGITTPAPPEAGPEAGPFEPKTYKTNTRAHYDPFKAPIAMLGIKVKTTLAFGSTWDPDP